MKKKVMKFGIVLVVLAMATNAAFATNVFTANNGNTWFDAGNWSDSEIPNITDASLGITQIKNGEDAATAIVVAELELRDGSLQVGTSIANGDAADVTAPLTMDTLKSTSDSGGNLFSLNILNGDVLVNNDSEAQAENGNLTMKVAAGSTLTYNGRARFANSGDSAAYINIVNFEGTITTNRRFEVEKSNTTISLTGNGVWDQNGSAIFSTQDSDISDNAVHNMNDVLDIGRDESSTKDQVDAAINISGDGAWDGDTDDIEFRNAGKRLDVYLTDTGSFLVRNLRPDGAEGEVDLDVDGVGTYARVSGDLFMGSGTISITNRDVLDLNRLRLGNDGDAYMTAATTDRGISIDEYIQMGTALGNDSQLTIDNMRLDISDYVLFGTTD